MKNLLIFIFALLVFQTQAQTPGDTTKKVVYTEIVKIDSTNRFDLYKKAAKWFEAQGFEIIEENAMEGKLLGKSKLIVYTDKSVLAKPNGDFHYDVLIEVKDNKYKYLFNNFVYRYYKQDRNLQYVPVKGSKPIEDSKAPGWKKQWGKNKMQVTADVNGRIAGLKTAMKYVTPAPVATPKAKEEW